MDDLNDTPLVEDPPLSEKEKSLDQTLEMSIGIKWFSRAGIVALLIGFAMALNYSFPYLNSILIPEVKLLIGGIVAIGLFLGGTKLLERFQLLGRILQGGGFSLGYLTLYGMFFIPAVQIFAEPHLQSLGWGLLLLYVGGMLIFSRSIGSRSIALLSLGFGYYTASYAGTQLTALLSATLLGCATVAASRRKGWEVLSQVGLIGGLLTCVFWHFFGNTSTNHVNVMPSVVLGENLDQLVFLAVNYLLFHIASIRNSYLPQGMLMLNSLLSYSSFLVIQAGEPLLISGAVEGGLALVHLLSFGIVSKTKRLDRELLEGQLLLGSFYSVMAILGLLGAEMRPVAFAAEAMLLGLMSRTDRFHVIYTILSVFFLFASFLSLLFFDWTSMPAFTLLSVVGLVSLVSLMLEANVYKNNDRIGRICLMIVSSFVFLTALMIGLQSYWITLATVITAFVLLMGGFISHQSRYRWMGLCWMFLAGFRLFTVDLLTLETPYKVLLFLVLGVTLLAGSYGYNQLSQRQKIALPTSEET